MALVDVVATTPLSKFSLFVLFPRANEALRCSLFSICDLGLLVPPTRSGHEGPFLLFFLFSAPFIVRRRLAIYGESLTFFSGTRRSNLCFFSTFSFRAFDCLILFLVVYETFLKRQSRS